MIRKEKTPVKSARKEKLVQLDKKTTVPSKPKSDLKETKPAKIILSVEIAMGNGGSKELTVRENDNVKVVAREFSRSN